MENKDTLRVVIDTNVLLRCISRKSACKIIVDKLYEGAFELFITNDILLEYEEKLSEIFSPEVSELFLGAIMLLTNVKKIEIHYLLKLISVDPDDNKFVDCSFAGNVHFLVTDDHHYNVLNGVSFPQINLLKIDEFKALLAEI